MDKSNQLITSLLAAKVKIPRFGVVENDLSKHVLPVVDAGKYIEPLKLKTTSDEIAKNADEYKNNSVWSEDKRLNETKQFFPLGLRAEGETDFFYLPFEPMININGKNNIIKRSVAKNVSRGTIKERWAQDDFTIEITGFLMDENMRQYPREDYEKLRDYLINGKKLEVLCEPLQLLDIHMIVVEDYSFPFTKGENMQQFTINAVSDDVYQLLIQTDKVFGSV